MPNITGISGSNFFVKYREKNYKQWSITEQIITDDFIILTLPQNHIYEFVVVSVDGEFSTESFAKDLSTGKSKSLILNQKITLIQIRIELVSNMNRNLF